jgi:hypothetical protein
MKVLVICFLFVIGLSYAKLYTPVQKEEKKIKVTEVTEVEEEQLEEVEPELLIDSIEPKGIVSHAKWQTTQDVTYDPNYVVLKYPNGDVSKNKGVCIDVVIRAYRSVGQDLQVLMHEDIANNLSSYGLSKADANIDHRRCVNAIKYFKRKNLTVPITDNEADYKPGDLVFWDIAHGHVGVVSDILVPGTNRYYMVHNICCGPQLEDYLFQLPITCHVRWSPI